MAWYEKKWLVWLMIIVFFPVGLILMWRSSNFGTKTKVLVTAFFALLIIGGSGQKDKSSVTATENKPTPKVEQPAPKQYAAVDANTLMNDLERNAAAAQVKYKGKLVCVTGRIGVIDSNGDYILIQSDNQFAINGIICSLNKSDKSQINFLMNVQKGQYIRAYGEINDVGELTYSPRINAGDSVINNQSFQ